MSTTLAYMMLFGGCIYLLIGGDFLVRGALALSRRTSISPMIMGLSIVAMGTSAPELIISLHSSLGGYPGIAIGNVVGSNIANVLLVIGVPALIQPIVPSTAGMGRSALLMVGVSIIFVAMCFAGYIGQFDGWLLIGVLVTAAVLMIRGHFSMPGMDFEEIEQQKKQVVGLPKSVPAITALIILGALFLPVGASLAVDGAVEVATSLGVSEAAIGSTLVALGTSLPELSSTLMAAYRHNAGMALGNVIGSNVLNIVAIMGITAAVVDVPVPAEYLLRDIWVMLASTLLLALYVMRRKPLARGSGIAFCGAYVWYCWAVL